MEICTRKCFIRKWLWYMKPIKIFQNIHVIQNSISELKKKLFKKNFQILWKSRCHVLVTFHLIWKNYVLYWDFDLKSWIVDFFTRFTREKTPQNNLSSQNFSVENNYSYTVERKHMKYLLFLHSAEKTRSIALHLYIQLRMCSYSIKTHFFFNSVMRLLVTREVISTVICHFSINSFYELFMSIALAICSMISLIIHVIDNEEIRSKRLHMVCKVQT